jgi:hypothetical protein
VGWPHSSLVWLLSFPEARRYRYVRFWLFTLVAVICFGGLTILIVALVAWITGDGRLLPYP